MSARAPQGTARRAFDDAMTEDHFLNTVIDLAQQGGWLAQHSTPATVMRRGKPLRITHQKGSMGFPDPKRRTKGFYDLVLVRDGTVLLWELKTETGSTDEEQRAWQFHGGDHARVLRPRDLPEIREILLAPRRRRAVA